MQDAHDLLRYWLEDGLELGWPSRSLGSLWFGGGDAVDQAIRDRFGPLVHQAIDRGLDAGLPLVGRVFLAMPLTHAEDLALQDRCVSIFEHLQAGADAQRAEDLQGHLDAAREHRAIIAILGRFAHRDAALGRTTSAAEQAYLTAGKRFGQ